MVVDVEEQVWKGVRWDDELVHDEGNDAIQLREDIEAEDIGFVAEDSEADLPQPEPVKASTTSTPKDSPEPSFAPNTSSKGRKELKKPKSKGIPTRFQPGRKGKQLASTLEVISEDMMLPVVDSEKGSENNLVNKIQPEPGLPGELLLYHSYIL